MTQQNDTKLDGPELSSSGAALAVKEQTALLHQQASTTPALASQAAGVRTSADRPSRCSRSPREAGMRYAPG